MKELFEMMALAAKTSESNPLRYLGIFIIPAVIVIIVLIGKTVGKKKANKFLEEIQHQHPFKESMGNVHITDDGLILIEHAADLTKSYGTKNGYLAIAYKLEDIHFVCPYVHRVRFVNKYGHGNQHTDFFAVTFLDENKDPILPTNVGKKKLSKSELKRIEKGTQRNGLSLSSEKEQAEAIAFIRRHAPQVQVLDYQEMQERKDTRNYMAKK